MDDLIERLRERAESYRQSGPSAEHTAKLLDEAAIALASDTATIAGLTKEIERLKALFDEAL
jgi:hypothetical protein